MCSPHMISGKNSSFVFSGQDNIVPECKSCLLIFPLCRTFVARVEINEQNSNFMEICHT